MSISFRSRLSLNNTLIAVIIRSFISGVEMSMIGVVFQPFVLSLGASMSQLGFLNSLGGFGGLISTLASPCGGWLCFPTKQMLHFARGIRVDSGDAGTN